MKSNIAIIGGGVIGSSIAYHLARTGKAGDIVVIEPDSSYARAATPNGAGGVRQLFSRPENIWMSQYSLQFYKEFDSAMAVDDTSASIDFNQRGYLFVVGESGAKQLEINHNQQSQQGVYTELLDRHDLERRYPSLGLDDIVLGCLSPHDGTLNTAPALQGFRRKAEQLGAQYVEARVIGLAAEKNRVHTAHLETGESVQADVFVNAAGAWASEITAMLDVPEELPLPIVPMCRVKHYWTCPQDIEPLPLVKDESGLFFRPLDGGFVGGRPSWAIKPGFNFAKENQAQRDYFQGYFERVVQPLLIARAPAFEQAQCQQSWTGHYAQNTLDGNMIIGPLGDSVENLHLACGFSGHGIMHAPAVGLALSELILAGRFETMNLTHMSYQRVLDDAPYPEEGII